MVLSTNSRLVVDRSSVVGAAEAVVESLVPQTSDGSVSKLVPSERHPEPLELLLAERAVRIGTSRTAAPVR